MTRILGNQLGESGYVTIYRAVLADVTYFKHNDYVTLSLKWAIGHAEHVAAVEEEKAVVLASTVLKSQVHEAHNPGEYFYAGPTKNGRVVKVVNP